MWCDGFGKGTQFANWADLGPESGLEGAQTFWSEFGPKKAVSVTKNIPTTHPQQGSRNPNTGGAGQMPREGGVM